MVRPRKEKWVNFNPNVTYFKPRNIPLSQLREIEITLDELETLRLSNIKKLNQTDAAKEMKIHQSTFQRTLTRAREKITDAIVNGKAIKIHGGEYKMSGRNGTGPAGIGAGRGRGLGRGLGVGRGTVGMGSGGICKCPSCGYEEPHVRAQLCNQKKCPKCGTLMTRK